MPSPKKSALNWSACKRVLHDWPHPGVVALVQELYELSDDNRRFLHARLVPERSAETLNDIKRKLGKMLSMQAVFNGNFKHAAAKRIIDQFAKANDDPAALADLLLFDLDAGFSTLAEVGDFEPMVDHLYAVLDRLDKTLPDMSPEQLSEPVERLNALAKRWGSSFGYGISDQLSGLAVDWNERKPPRE